MAQYENNAFFWQKVDTLYFSSKFILARQKGNSHPEYPQLIYPVDYGYLVDSASLDQSKIAAFKGSRSGGQVNTIILAADILKKDLEVKVLIGCTEAEETDILQFMNQTDFQKTILLRRGNEIPTWGASD